DRPTFAARVAEVRRKLPIGAVIEQHVKLSGSASSRNRRGKCPFHSGNSPSFSVKDGDKADGFGHCFGCAWHGDVVSFVRDIAGLSFVDALSECERKAGISDGGSGHAGAGPVQRERNVAPKRARQRELIEPIEMAREIWRRAAPNRDAVRRYFLGRGVPAAVLTDRRMSAFRYLAECPCVSWDRGAGADGRTSTAPPAGLPIAPAIMAMMRVPTRMEGDTGHWLEWVPTGLHVTYLNPAGDGTMIRRKPWAKPDDADPLLPKRRMLGPAAGACILLEEYRPGAHLWIGEGNETVLSGMALAGADEAALAVAVLSLDNLQGGMRMWKNRTWPLHAIAPDPERPAFLVPGHRGPVTGLIDSDMSPLRGMKDQRTGAPLGEAVVERKGGPIVRRAITGAERARICGELFVKSWRAAGANPVDALRAPMGMDFNDAARAAKEAV
ncbi:MAG: CHC2 zinc finger domain-containing protein, partial [Novosphingobium sp.]